MSGTVAGGKRAAQTNKERYGEDFYKVQGGKGGAKTGIPKGFSLSGKAKEAGSRGGKISKRGPTVYVTYNGERVSLSDVAKREGITYRKAHSQMTAGTYERL